MYGKILLTMFILALFLASCAPAALPAPTPTPFPEEFEGKAKVGDYELKISCEGSGEPTVILERGVREIRWSQNRKPGFVRSEMFMVVRRENDYP